MTPVASNFVVTVRMRVSSDQETNKTKLKAHFCREDKDVNHEETAQPLPFFYNYFFPVFLPSGKERSCGAPGTGIVGLGSQGIVGLGSRNWGY